MIDTTKYKYGFEMSAEDTLDCLTEMAWAKVDGGSVFDMLQFHCCSDPGDSAFAVSGYPWEWKRGIKEAVFHAYNAWQAQLKEERRQQYLTLKAEFDPQSIVS